MIFHTVKKHLKLKLLSVGFEIFCSTLKVEQIRPDLLQFQSGANLNGWNHAGRSFEIFEFPLSGAFLEQI
jgi:hypothetical protein